jgi:hemoglobin
MNVRTHARIGGTALVVWLAFTSAVIAGESPTVEDQMAGLVAMCAESEQARAQRHAETPLYDRLGGSEKITAMTAEIIRLHSINPDFRRFWGEIDEERLIKNVSDFVSTGTGGPKVYEGRDMPTAHAHLELSAADFLSAGGDVMHAMQNKGYGENEIQEMVCILVSMKDLVITK